MDTSQSPPPHTPNDDPVTTARGTQDVRLIAVLGTLLTASSLALLLSGARSYFQIESEDIFKDAGNATQIVDTIRSFSSRMQNALMRLLLGLTSLLLGGCLITYALYWGRLRTRWFYWSTLILGWAVIWLPPFGTLFGLAWLWDINSRKAEFSPATAAPALS